jgi:hypothetical protein
VKVRQNFFAAIATACIAFFFMCSQLLQAQSATPFFEGKIVYKVQFTGFGQGNQYRYMVPDSVVLWMAGNQCLQQAYGGLLPERTLRDDSNRVFVIDTLAKTMISYSDTLTRPNYTVVLQGDGGMVAGYRCRLYKVIIDLPHHNGQIVQMVWATPALAVSPPRLPLAKQPAIHGSGFLSLPGIQGVILKIHSPFNKQAGIDLTLMATRVTRCTVAPELFRRPANYKVVEFDSNMQVPLR